jgi:hypothetical protein
VHFLDLGNLGNLDNSRYLKAQGLGNGDVFVNLRYMGDLPQRFVLESPGRSVRGETFYVFMTVADGAPRLPRAEVWKRLLTSVVSIDYYPGSRVVVVGDGSEEELRLVKAGAPGYLQHVEDHCFLSVMSFAALKQKVGERMFNLIMEP